MNTATTTAIPEELFDGRELSCEIKRPAFLARCTELPVGRTFVFVNSHDPVPLRQHLDKLYPGCFRWELLAGAEADTIRLRVTKLAAPAGGFGSDAAAVSCH